MSDNPIFRLRSGRDRASGSELPQRGGQRQSDGQDQDGAGRNDGSKNVGRRFAFARRDSSPVQAAEELRTVPESVRVSSGTSDPLATIGEIVNFYKAKGIQIIPARRGDKFPTLEWRELSQRQGLDYAETIALFGGNENAPADSTNYAVLAGIPSGGLVVLDFDTAERGLAHPVDTFTVETGKGRHYYIRVRDTTNIGNASYRRASLDIRGVGGIAIAPPSLHPSGRMYRVVDDKPILEVSASWYRDYLAQALDGTGDSDNGERERKPLGWFAEAFGEVAPQGGRDNTATSLAGKLLNSLHSSDVRAILYVWAEAKCDPPLPRHDIDRIVSSLERKRRFDELSETPERDTTQPLEHETPIGSGPEDAIFAGIAEASKRRREGRSTSE